MCILFSIFLLTMQYEMNALKVLRQKKGMTQKDLAESSGVSIRTIQRIEGSDAIPKGYTLRKLSEILGQEPDDFQDLFFNTEVEDKKAYARLKWMNLSGLLFFLIPFSNVFVPIALRSRMKGNKDVLEEADKIVNFHCTWGIILVCSLSISPFLDSRQGDIPLIILVLIVMVVSNLVFVMYCALRISDHKPLPSFGFRWI